MNEKKIIGYDTPDSWGEPCCVIDRKAACAAMAAIPDFGDFETLMEQISQNSLFIVEESGQFFAVNDAGQRCEVGNPAELQDGCISYIGRRWM